MNIEPLIPIPNENNIGQDKSKIQENLQQILIQQEQIDYSKYTNIDQLDHLNINQIDNNTFIVKKKMFYKRRGSVF